MWHQQFLIVWQQLNESRTGAGSKRSSLTGFVQSWFQVLQIPAQLEKSGWTEKQWTMCTARRFMISVKKHVLLIQNGPLTWSQMGWRRMTLVVMTARHCSCPPVLWAAAVQDAPDKQKQTVKHLFYVFLTFYLSKKRSLSTWYQYGEVGCFSICSWIHCRLIVMKSLRRLQ